MKYCNKCDTTKSLENFSKNKTAHDGKQNWCKICKNEANKVWENKNPGKANARAKAWDQANPGKASAKTAKRRAAKLKATVPWADKEAIERMYIIARFLTDKVGEPHHVDHIVPLQGKNICGFHVEYNLNVISAKDNCSKSNKFDQ